MIAEYTLPQFRWIDVQNPTESELQTLRTSYSLDFNIVKDLQEPISDTRVITCNNQHYFAFHHTAASSLKTEPHWHEIDMIIYEDIIITVIYDSVQVINSLRKELEIERTLKHEVEVDKEGFIINLIGKLHQDLRMLIAAINNHQRRIETEIFNGSERQMVRTISETGRVLFSLNQTNAEQAHLIKFFPTTLQNTLPKLYTAWDRELQHTADQTKAQYDLYHDLRRTNEELLATKQNEVMSKLTLVAFITSPLTILAGIFGMNTRSTPLVGGFNDFWMIIALMSAIVLLTVAALYRKGWFK